MADQEVVPYKTEEVVVSPQSTPSGTFILNADRTAIIRVDGWNVDGTEIGVSVWVTSDLDTVRSTDPAVTMEIGSGMADGIVGAKAYKILLPQENEVEADEAQGLSIDAIMAGMDKAEPHVEEKPQTIIPPAQPQPVATPVTEPKVEPEQESPPEQKVSPPTPDDVISGESDDGMKTGPYDGNLETKRAWMYTTVWESDDHFITFDGLAERAVSEGKWEDKESFYKILPAMVGGLRSAGWDIRGSEDPPGLRVGGPPIRPGENPGAIRHLLPGSPGSHGPTTTPLPVQVDNPSDTLKESLVSLADNLIDALTSFEESIKQG